MVEISYDHPNIYCIILFCISNVYVNKNAGHIFEYLWQEIWNCHYRSKTIIDQKKNAILIWQSQNNVKSIIWQLSVHTLEAFVLWQIFLQASTHLKQLNRHLSKKPLAIFSLYQLRSLVNPFKMTEGVHVHFLHLQCMSNWQPFRTCETQSFPFIAYN